MKNKIEIYAIVLLILVAVSAIIFITTRPSKGNFNYQIDSVLNAVETLDNYKETIKINSKDADGIEYIVEKEAIYKSLSGGDFQSKERRGITNTGRFIGTEFEYMSLDDKKYINVKTNPNPTGESPFPLNIWIALPNTKYTDLNSKNFETLINQLSQENIATIIKDLQSYSENHSTKQSINIKLENDFIQKLESVFGLYANITDRTGDVSVQIEVNEKGTLTRFIISYSNGSIEYTLDGIDQQSITLPQNIISQ